MSGELNNPQHAPLRAHASVKTHRGTAALRDLTSEDVDAIARYWFTSSDEFLDFMGIDRERLGTIEDTRKRFLRAMRTGGSDQQSFALAIMLDNEFIGYTLLNRYAPEENYSHWHITNPDFRGAGISAALYPHRIKTYFDLVPIERLIHRVQSALRVSARFGKVFRKSCGTARRGVARYNIKVTFPKFRGWRLVLSLASGLALALAYPNYNLPLLGWVSVAGLLYACLGAGVGEAALYGFLYGMVCYTFSLPWVYTVLQQYGPLPVWEASGVFMLLAMFLSVFTAFFATVFAWMARRSVSLALVASPFLWVAVELGRMRLPQTSANFPWDLLGYVAAGNLALVQITSITGIYGLSFLVAAYAAMSVWALSAPAGTLQRRAVAAWAGITVLLVAVAAFGGHFVPQALADRVAHLVQTDLPQSLDYPANWGELHATDMAQLDTISIGAGLRGSSPGGMAPNLAGAQRASQTPNTTDEQPSLLDWPEVPATVSLQDPGFAQRAEHLAEASHSDFLVGELDWKPSDQPNHRIPYNSAALLDPTGREQFLYDKMHLVPFGEFFPWREFFFFAKDLEGIVGDFGVGTRHAVGDLPGGKFGVFICYEAIFPDHVRQFVQNGAGLLINISNDGWFGRSAAAAQHLNQARVRAVENRRWLLRDTNNGYTASVDPYGRIVATMPADTRGELEAPYAFREDRTIYTQWGDWLPWLSLLVSACFVVAAAVRGKTPSEEAPVVANTKSRGKTRSQGNSAKRAVTKGKMQ